MSLRIKLCGIQNLSFVISEWSTSSEDTSAEDTTSSDSSTLSRDRIEFYLPQKEDGDGKLYLLERFMADLQGIKVNEPSSAKGEQTEDRTEEPKRYNLRKRHRKEDEAQVKKPEKKKEEKKYTGSTSYPERPYVRSTGTEFENRGLDLPGCQEADGTCFLMNRFLLDCMKKIKPSSSRNEDEEPQEKKCKQ